MRGASNKIRLVQTCKRLGFSVNCCILGNFGRYVVQALAYLIKSECLVHTRQLLLATVDYYFIEGYKPISFRLFVKV